MNTTDLLGLVHPAIAVALVFPTIGIVANFAWQTRQRRLQTAQGTKSKIPPLVGPEHVAMGRWLTGMVVGVTLIGIGRREWSSRLPFGPYLALGAMAWVFGGARWWGWMFGG